MRPQMEAQMLWVLSGVALRISQRIGLQYDGASPRLSVFETEMRRRLWWQIISAELSGVGTSIGSCGTSIALLLKVDDGDLNPNMREISIEHIGITEMSFVTSVLRLADIYRPQTEKMFDSAWQHLTSEKTSLSEKIQEINELERLIEQKFLRYCDDSSLFPSSLQ